MDLPEVLEVTRERIEADGLSDCLETETADSSLWSEIYSLFMLVVCESEGRERPESEHRALLEQAGFLDVEPRRSEGPRDLIVARKP